MSTTLAFGVRDSDTKIENAVLKSIQEAGHPVSLDELLGRLQSLDDIEVREAMWRLIDAHLIVLTPNRQLTTP